nr:MAG TPA: hypothetical protein [Bacteriophage sp.]
MGAPLPFYSFATINHLSLITPPIAPKISAHSRPGEVLGWKGSDGGATGVRVRHRQTPGGMPRARLARQGGLVRGHAQSTTNNHPAAPLNSRPPTRRVSRPPDA